MIKKLQRKFIIITMISVIIVLATIMTIVNVLNYKNITKDVDVILDALLENGGRFEHEIMLNDETKTLDERRLGPNSQKKDTQENETSTVIEGETSKDIGDFYEKREFRGDFGKLDKLGAETPYETRFFTVLINSNNDVIWTNTGSVVSVDASAAKDYAKKILEMGSERGYIDNYRYGYQKYSDTGETLVVCIDCNQRLNAVSTFLKASILISILGTIAVGVLVFLLSYRVMKPIAESYEKQKRFITDSNHEIKTPLAVISANTEVIEMTEGESEWTNGIKKQVERLAELTRNLTMLAKMDEDDMRIVRQNFDISTASKEVFEGFVVLANNKGIKIEEKIEEGISYEGSEKDIRQLMSILLDNAIKYAKDKIVFTVKKHKGKVRIEVYNTADNVEPGSLDKYFDRFYRADASRNKSVEGFGIGLSIAKSIVEKHGGKISAKSEDGASAVFKVTL